MAWKDSKSGGARTDEPVGAPIVYTIEERDVQQKFIAVGIVQDGLRVQLSGPGSGFGTPVDADGKVVWTKPLT